MSGPILYISEHHPIQIYQKPTRPDILQRLSSTYSYRQFQTRLNSGHDPRPN